MRNVERAGGSLAVVIDDTGASDVKNIIMSDDGTGTGIRIPSMLISKADGQRLKEFLKKAGEDESKKASLSAEFIFENHSNQVSWELWYTSANDKALDFIRNFGESSALLSDTVKF